MIIKPSSKKYYKVKRCRKAGGSNNRIQNYMFLGEYATIFKHHITRENFYHLEVKNGDFKVIRTRY